MFTDKRELLPAPFLSVNIRATYVQNLRKLRNLVS